jgi:8-oxo-dGTP pyrophosphatase MutT (NUDIX family)
MKKASCVLIIDLESQRYLSIYKNLMNYNIPGGKCFSNETSIDCAIREIKEETNLDIKEDDITLLLEQYCDNYLVSTYLTYHYNGQIIPEDNYMLSFVPIKNLLINENKKWIKYHKKLIKILSSRINI